ncbi:hypothetical protein C2G38_2158307 [Gigaspora rosea]|uniref:Uncharacterized protein n=1 Tax=Gigaspora rosea TaxID=44941 RepID=A0A397W2J9_9GLOM|nr:hypothetical protein C2G38_2158307 [Gigaspora rosea]
MYSLKRACKEGIDDGSSNKYSGTFTVFQARSAVPAAAPATAPSSSFATLAPAPSGAASSVPSVSSSPAAKAHAPAASSGP